MGGVRQGVSPDVFTLSSLIVACKASNYWEEALEVAEDFSSTHGVQLNTLACNALIATLGKAGRWQYALQVSYARGSRFGGAGGHRWGSQHVDIGMCASEHVTLCQNLAII